MQPSRLAAREMLAQRGMRYSVSHFCRIYNGLRRVPEEVRCSNLIQISPSITAYVVGNEPVFRPLTLALKEKDFESVECLARRLLNGSELNEHEFRARLHAFVGTARVGQEDYLGAADSYRVANRIAADHVPELLPRMTASLSNWESQLRWDAYQSGKLPFRELQRIYNLMLEELRSLTPVEADDVGLVLKTIMRLSSRLNLEKTFETAWNKARTQPVFGRTESDRDKSLRGWLRSDEPDFKNAMSFQCVLDSAPLYRTKKSMRRMS